MKYDLASKVLLSRCKDEILRTLAGLSITSSTLLETAPQETASLRRADFAIRAMFDDGSERLILVEFLSSWRRHFPVRLLEYRCRHLLEEKMQVISLIILLVPVAGALNVYEDEEVRFEFRLVSIPDFEAGKIMELDIPCLMPFVPLMKDGDRYLDEADRRIYEGTLSKETKSDLLTGMAILGGLVSRNWPMEMIKRRRDIMIESAAYDIIKQEGYEEGIKAGIQQGIEKGIQQGIQQGIREGLVEAVELGLKLRFGTEGLQLLPSILKIQDNDKLRVIKEFVEYVDDLQEIRKLVTAD